MLESDLATIARSEELGIYEREAEAIAGTYFNRNLTGLPMGTDISDKTGRVAGEWREQLEKDFKKVWHMYVVDKTNKQLEYDAWVLKVRRIDLAIESLLPKEQDVIKMYYIQGMTFGKIGKKIGYDERSCRHIRDRAVWYMSLSLFPRRVV